MKKAFKVTVPVIAKDITEAKIGPTQGVHKIPSEMPTKSPDPKPGLRLVLGAKELSLTNNCSIQNWNLGIKKVTPKTPIIITEAILKVSRGIPNKLTMVDKKSVKKVKLKTKPVTIPNGRDLPKFLPAREEDKTIGNSGKIQGESTVTNPARKANSKSKAMFDKYIRSLT